MSKYILGETIGLSYNASSKARDDINFLAQKFGYSMIANNDKRNSKSIISKIYMTCKAILQLFLRIKKEDILLVQSSLKVLPFIGFMKRVKKFKIIYLIHDLDAVRDNYDNQKAVHEEIHKLLSADYIIAHNDVMVNFLKKKGITVPVISLGVFDYVMEDDKSKAETKQSLKGNTIVFAGNLSPTKTGFIEKLDKTNHIFEMNLYGNSTRSYSSMNYCGRYNPEELPNVMNGDYGLVWEGNDLYVDENDNPYIMLNNPHKVSLYIVSGLPIIIWKKAALADFIKNYNLGIVIDNLELLDSELNTVSPEEYKNIKTSVMRMRKSLINGEHLRKALDIIEQKIFGEKGFEDKK